MKPTHALSVCAVAVAALCLISTMTPAGDLDPPSGAITETMKTLDQVEPRIPINRDNTPGDANSAFKISAPGSYYLTSEILGSSGRHGIEIGADDVTVDLMGFTVRGVPSSFAGITSDGTPASNIRVTNGVVRGWDLAGISLNVGANHRVDAIHATENKSGIVCDDNAIVQSCTAADNDQDGIVCGGINAAVRACAVQRNGGHGIRITGGGSVTACAADANGGAGMLVAITSIADCSVSNNLGDGIVASGSTITGCYASSNADNGIRATGSIVSHSVASANTRDGIQASGTCFIIHNSCSGNPSGGVGAEGAAIRATGTNNRIEANNVSGNDVGIAVDSVSNLIIRNSAQGHNADYDIVPGNRVGSIVSGEVLMNTAPNDLINISTSAVPAQQASESLPPEGE